MVRTNGRAPYQVFACLHDRGANNTQGPPGKIVMLCPVVRLGRSLQHELGGECTAMVLHKSARRQFHRVALPKLLRRVAQHLVRTTTRG